MVDFLTNTHKMIFVLRLREKKWFECKIMYERILLLSLLIHSNLSFSFFIIFKCCQCVYLYVLHCMLIFHKTRSLHKFYFTCFHNDCKIAKYGLFMFKSIYLLGCPIVLLTKFCRGYLYYIY